MKKVILFALMIAFAAYGFSQETGKKLTKIPAIDVKNLDGEVFNTSEISNDGKPIIISFWALWCKPCIRELTTIADVYDDWIDETGVKLYAVSIDDARSSAKVLPTVNGKGWDYEVLLDQNSDFKRVTNNAGGIEGGMSNGEEIIIKGFMKPIATLMDPLDTVNVDTKKKDKAATERSDTAAVEACSVVAEAVCAIEIARALVEKFGCDSIEDIKSNVKTYKDRLREM